MPFAHCHAGRRLLELFEVFGFEIARAAGARVLAVEVAVVEVVVRRDVRLQEDPLEEDLDDRLGVAIRERERRAVGHGALCAARGARRGLEAQLGGGDAGEGAEDRQQRVEHPDEEPKLPHVRVAQLALLLNRAARQHAPHQRLQPKEPSEESEHACEATRSARVHDGVEELGVVVPKLRRCRRQQWAQPRHVDGVEKAAV